MFELILVPNFSLNQQFWLFWPNLPKKGITVTLMAKRNFAKQPIKRNFFTFTILMYLVPKVAEKIRLFFINTTQELKKRLKVINYNSWTGVRF